MLTDARIKSLKTKDKPYKTFDFEGLYLLVKPNGSKLWYMKYRFLDKEKKLSLGKYPVISLQQARDIKIAARKLIAAGEDPQANKTAEKRQRLHAADCTFQKIALKWMDHAGTVWADKTRQTKLRRLEMYIFPNIQQGAA